MNVITKTVELPDGRTISIETGKLAKQADGAVMLTMGNTMLLATVCAAKDAVPGTDFMPLQVEYREKYAAAGRFPGGFTKREGKASDKEILTCRLVDRALRPLFPSNFHAEVYVNVILYSADGVDMPDALAGFAASAALSVSDIPFEGPISEVRVARINGEYVVNPTFAQLEQADMDIMVGATEENIMMVEGEMKEVSEQDLLQALKVAHEAIKPMCRLQKELEKETGKDVKREYCHEVNDEELREEVKKACYDAAYRIAAEGNRDKHAREDAFMEIRENFKAAYAEAHTDLSAEELEEKNIPIMRAEVGPVSRRDLIEISVMKDELYKTVLCFNVPLLPDAEAMVRDEEVDVKIFSNRVIYKLIDDYIDWRDELTRAREAKQFETVVLPAKFSILPDCVFRQSGPAVVGVRVLGGILRPHVGVATRDGKVVGEIKQIKLNKENIQEAKEGLEVAVSIEGVTIGRQIDVGETLYVAVPERHVKVLETEMLSHLNTGTQEALEEYTNIFRKTQPFWGK